MKKVITGLISLALLCGCSSASATSVRKESSEYTCRNINFMDLSEPVVKSQEKVDDSWFADSLFIGDARMGSVALYSDLGSKGAEIIYDESLGVFSMSTMPVQMSSSTAYDIMIQSAKKHIYYWLGLNELAYASSDEWQASLNQLISDTVTSHPDSDVYVIATLMPKSVFSISGDELKQEVSAQNEKLLSAASSNGAYYIDLSSEMCDKSGVIKDEYLWGDYTLNTDGAQQISDLIAYYTVNRESYVKKICE